MIYDGIRGTKTGREYRYADCHIQWNGYQWIAFPPNGGKIIARARGIKPMRDILHTMKINKEGPWA